MAELQQHWQDFEKPVTIPANVAGDMYRSALSLKTTTRILADHLLRLNSHGELEPRFSSVELEAMVSGAVVLAEGMETALEDLHLDSFDKPAELAS